MDNIIKVIIVEDKKESSNYLKKILEKLFPEIRVQAISTNIVSAIKSIEKYKPNLLFLDIVLKDGLSFEILEKTSYSDFEIIFTTGYDTYYQKAFEYCAFNYLLKPVNPEQLNRVIKKFKKNKEIPKFNKKKVKLNAFLDKENPKIIINLGDENIFVAIKDIILCKAKGSYCEIIFNNKKHLTSKPLKYYENLFSNNNFFKANRSILVNISHITSIYKKETLTLSNNENVNISIRNRNVLSELLSYYT
ncbi:LytR/AlgR family response regulator transcription factor [Tenacibaculum sp. nBUS_03]|uniref:LytR/AlgR family response regulator transcription factor n=1 Tax=Tenacibaculum sp. nBUS_03 TaxID=3395320 RepID=UPI003EBF946B